MPQMSPLNIYFYFIFFLFLFIIIVMLNYYLKSFKLKKYTRYYKKDNYNSKWY